MEAARHGGRWLLAAALIAAAAAASGPADARPAAGPPELKAEGDPRAGHVSLSWRIPDGEDVGSAADSNVPRYQLQEAVDPSFAGARDIYTGPHTASVVSGLPDGTRHFRVRAAAGAGQPFGPWSEPAEFTTRHHALGLSVGLFLVGAMVFACTAAFIVIGSRRAHG